MTEVSQFMDWVDVLKLGVLMIVAGFAWSIGRSL